MDIPKLLKNVNSLNDYIYATQEFSTKYSTIKVQVNITTALALKKIRSLEIEYLNKCEENGVACMIFERLLSLPPSKTWGVLGKELVSLIQYWLDAVRKHLIHHSPHWWTFLKLLMKFIHEIRPKASSVAGVLAECTAESLLELATAERCDALQRHQILHCFNSYSADCSRGLRLAMRHKLSGYFSRVCAWVRGCGFLPAQYAALEALLRWLVPRHDAALRRDAAALWFPNDMYPKTAVDIFLNAQWINFYQDARDFLNALNDAKGTVTSVPCKKLCIGNITVTTGSDKHWCWVDVNAGCKSVSVQLGPRGDAARARAVDTLLVTEQTTVDAKLYRAPSLTLSLSTSRPPALCPPAGHPWPDTLVSAQLGARADLRRLDRALRDVFGDKYQLALDLDGEIELSPEISGRVRSNKGSEDETRFSNPVGVKKPRHYGYMVRSKTSTNSGFPSPSTASTSSLAHLHEKLAALPRYKYDKEPAPVCLEPQLSMVQEVSEKSFCSNSTLKLRPYGVCKRSVKAKNRHSQSDSETIKNQTRILNPVVSDDNDTSCLLLATIGTDDTIINDTVQRLSKSKDFNNHNIVDLIVQEALQENVEEKVSDSGINTDDNKKSQESIENDEAIEDTPVQEVPKSVKRKLKQKNKKCTIVSNTTDDESNTEAICETPVFVNTRRNTRIVNEVEIFETEKQIFDEQTIEKFFSQHYTEKGGNIIISPTLARKINESSSDTSEHFEEQCLVDELRGELFEFNDLEIIECLNDIVDKVCTNFDKCTEYYEIQPNTSHVAETQELNEDTAVMETPQKPGSRQRKSIKLKFETKRRASSARSRKKESVKTKNTTKKTNINSPKKMSTIVEQTDEDTVFEPIDILPDKNNSPILNEKGKSKKDIQDSPSTSKIETPNKPVETSAIRKKRKLYSPKDEENQKEIIFDAYEADDDDTTLANIKTKNAKATTGIYKEIENERKKYNIRKPRSKKNKPDPPSPRTTKMDAVFDKLKESVESNEKITFADKTNTRKDAYNFTSDSEDDDFKTKKVDISKRVSATTSFESTMATRKRRQANRVNYSESKSSNDETRKKKEKVVKRKKPTKRAIKGKTSPTIEPVQDIIDEGVRELVPEALNTSLVINQDKEIEEGEIQPKIPKIIAMEPFAEETSKKTKKRNVIKTIKKEKDVKNENRKLNVISDKENIERDTTTSPLPGLVVESAPAGDDTNDSVTETMAQKFRKIYQDGQDVIESDNTQNLLLDNELYTSVQVSMNITDELTLMHSENKQEFYKPIKIKQENAKKERTLKTIEKNEARKTTNKEMDEIVVLSTVDGNSEANISIQSYGINAHGDVDELPPSREMIKTRYQPREIEDLDGSVKEYFLTLNKAVCGSSKDRESIQSRDGEEVSNILGKEAETTGISPVISMKRLSLDDISRWLPSGRTTETENSDDSPKMKKSKTSSHKSDSIKKSQILPISKISMEEFDKWLPMPKALNLDKTEKSDGKKRTKYTSNIDRDSVEDTAENSHEKKAKGGNNNTNVELVIRTRSQSKSTMQKTVDKSRTSSIIQPVKTFEDFASNIQEDEDDCIKKIRDLFSNKPNKITRVETKSSIKRASSPVPSSSMKKIKHKAPVSETTSVSSVHEWLNRAGPSVRDDTTCHIGDILHNVMEKLDTTLVETNRNTSKKFVNLFVEAQKHLSAQMEARESMYKQALTDIITRIIGVVDETFTELSHKSQETENKFMEQLKKQASDLIREDSNKKRAMVKILKEDVQAVMDHMVKNTRDDSD